MRRQDVRLIEHPFLIRQSQMSVCVADIDEQDHDCKSIERAEICREREAATCGRGSQHSWRSQARLSIGRCFLHEPTHPRPLPGGEQAFERAVSVPRLGGVRGGFMVPMRDETPWGLSTD